MKFNTKSVDSPITRREHEFTCEVEYFRDGVLVAIFTSLTISIDGNDVKVTGYGWRCRDGKRDERQSRPLKTGFWRYLDAITIAKDLATRSGEQDLIDLMVREHSLELQRETERANRNARR